MNLSGRAMEYERAGAAFRRRERRLRSWLRHERMTVRMELAAALHHSAGPGTNDAVRSQKTVSSRGVRPGVLQDPAPQLVSEHAARPCSSGVPSLSPPSFADAAGDSVDSATLRALTAAVLYSRKLQVEEARKSKEEEKKAKEKEMQKVAAVPGVGKWVELVDSDTGMTYFWNPQTNATRWTLPGSSSSSSTSKRKKKKRRKRKLPKCGLLSSRLWTSL